jgi:hypothetical protein
MKISGGELPNREIGMILHFAFPILGKSKTKSQF